ncbi:alpha/beta hydrolase [Sphingomonas sp. SORGH_AS_0950]|uniref:alpha/beta hydrolase n=1 Tax=Sphingomonas sp. SORGH_AS_0950 TaxID=3041792 RepID=UPI0027D8A948|nr:alpha/beta hydrolase [Sphingomonas sp. SORGH_AS_0950]
MNNIRLSGVCPISLRRYIVAGLALIFSVGFAAFVAPKHREAALPSKQTSAAQPDRQLVGVWTPPAGLVQEPIWPGAAPNSSLERGKAETVLTRWTPEALAGDTSQAVFNVSIPTMTIFPPKGHSTRAAIVVFPGGGFSAVVITSEGTEICKWLAEQGITCILSKYRVPYTGHHWDENCNCGVVPASPNALQDAQRTLRLVRSRATELGIDSTKIGAMGFSAGGYLTAQVSNIFKLAYRPVDKIDQVSSRPDFAIALYPGHICRPGRRIDPDLHVSRSAPPTFLAQAWDDQVDDICNALLYANALDQEGVPAEVHLFARGGHGFNLRKGKNASAPWPTLLQSWLRSIDIIG